jgi:hypothetical protein
MKVHLTIALIRPLSVVHDGGQLKLALDVRHAVGEDRWHRCPVDHGTTTTASIDTSVLGIKPRVELPVAKRDPDRIMIPLFGGV